MSDEIKLGLALGNTYEVLAKTSDGLKQVDKAAHDAAESYEVLAGAGTNYAKIQDASDKAVAAAVEQTRALKLMREALDDVPPATKKFDAGLSATGAVAKGVTNDMGSLSRGALQVSQAFQDVAQGGVASALNNVDGIVGSLARGLGFTATAAATASAALLGIGTVALIAAPAVKNLWHSFMDGAESLPPATDALSKLNDELATHKKRLDDLKERDGHLSSGDVADYSASSSRVKAIQEEIASLKESEAAEKAIRAAMTEREVKERREQADKVKQIVVGSQDDLLAAVKKGAADQSAAVRGERGKLIQELQNQNAKLANVWDVFGNVDAVKRVDAQKQAISDAMAKAGREGVVALQKAMTGDDAALQDVIKAVGPDSDFGRKLQSALRATWTQDDAIKGMLDRTGKVLDDFAEKFNKNVQKKIDDFNKSVERGADVAYAGLVKINDELDRQAEKDAEKDEKNAKDHPGQDIIRDVENQDFSRTTVDKYGREKTTAGLGLSRKQVEDAADAARDFQRTTGADDRTAAQMGIQEAIIRNQQMAADKLQQVQMRANMLQQQAQTVPTLLEFGNW